MTDIRAFVGHSFTPEDADVVRIFVEYLDQVRLLHPAFTWEHATGSEPRDLRDKVLDMVADKNVFIGICTRKERVASDDYFQKAMLSPGFKKVRSEKLQWKTSDWVIQEIGLAVGRGMPLILLIEEGVRQPGGIQGNIEYITFKRSAPSEVFGKLIEMIRALSPPASTANQVGDVVATGAAPTELLKSEDNDPKPTWTTADYFAAFFSRTIRGDVDGAAEINRAYLETPLSSQEPMGRWEARVEWCKVLFGTGGSLAKLRELAKQHADDALITSHFAGALGRFSEHEEAAQMYERAAALSTETHDKVAHLASAARHWRQAGKAPQSELVIQRMKAVAQPEQREAILRSLLHAAEAEKDDDLQVEALEGLAELTPDDATQRFSVAYKHSEIGNDDLGLFHYVKVPSGDRIPILWNNLGVAFQNFNMPGKSIAAYRRAAAGGESLAMSNLGYKFLNAGFFEEADTEFSRAQKVENYHKNVAEGVAALRVAPENEEKQEAEVLKEATKKASFYRSLGRAIAEPDADVARKWQGPACVFLVTVSNGQFDAVGEYEARNVFAEAAGVPPKPTKHHVRYQGKLVGRRISGTVKRWTDKDKPTTLLGFSTNEVSVPFSMILSEDATKLSVMENGRSRKPVFFEMHRIDETQAQKPEA